MSAGKSVRSAAASDPLRVDIAVWSLDLPPFPVEEFESWLSEDEIARADRFRLPHLRRRWIAARGGMRRLIADRLAVQPDQVAFSLGPHGKPCLAAGGADLSFNLSHSDHLAALAICEAAIGVDIERVADAPDSVARDQFSAAEYAALCGLPPGARIPAFYALWTSKEAVLKALGTGFSFASKGFTLDMAGAGEPCIVQADWTYPDKAEWQIRRFDPAEGFAGAVAVNTRRPLELAVTHWTGNDDTERLRRSAGE